MNNIPIILGAIALIYLLWDKISNLILNAKAAKLSKDVEAQKEKTNESVTKATIARDSFLERLRKYRAGRDSK